MKKKPHKPYSEMNTAELREATKEFDREHVGVIGKPLTKAQRELHRRARALARKVGRGGRPKVGEGVKVISLSVEQGLLRQADALAKRRKVSRAELVADALRIVLTGAKAG